MRPWSLPVTLSLLCTLIGVSSCRDATELTVTIRTNVSCEEVKAWQGVAVYVGEPGAESEGQAPTLVTKHCEDDGLIGSLVVVPSGAKDAVVGVRVVAGVAQSPEACAANGYKDGCIVARRSIRFTPHADLALDIDLSQSCLNIGCDPQSTCVDRLCKASSTVESSPTPSPMPTPAPGAGTVRCGDDGVFCPTSGDVCCLTVDVKAGATHGDCRPATRCQGIVLNCDDGTDCPDGGPDMAWKGVCVLSYLTNDETPYVPQGEISHSQCLIGHSGGVERPRVLGLCEENLPCANRFQCLMSEQDSLLLPNYHWCHLVFE